MEWKKSRRRRSRKEVWGGGEDGNGAAMIEERGRGNGKESIDEGHGKKGVGGEGGGQTHGAGIAEFDFLSSVQANCDF